MSKDFIFFGCWNNVNCDEKHNYRNIVLDYIKEFEQSVDTLILGGDNWYNNTVEKNDRQKYKHYYTSVLKSGYDKIYHLNKDTYIVLGNHDVNTDDNNTEENNKLKKGCMFNTQLYYLKNIAIDTNHTPSLEDLNDLEKITKYYLQTKRKLFLYDYIGYTSHEHFGVLYLNTNIFNTNDKNNIGNYMKNMKKKISQLKKKHDILFVVGHDPIISYKPKPDKKGNGSKEKKLLYVQDNSIAYYKFFKLLTQYKCIYLCADTHNFQISNISDDDNDNLVQIVSGTGGGDLDKLEITQLENEKYSFDYDKTGNNHIFTVKANLHPCYGYTKIQTVSNTEINITYIQVFSGHGNVEQHHYKLVFSDNTWKIQKRSIQDIYNNIIESNIITRHECYNTLLDNYIVTSIDKKIPCFVKTGKTPTTTPEKTAISSKTVSEKDKKMI